MGFRFGDFRSIFQRAQNQRRQQQEQQQRQQQEQQQRQQQQINDLNNLRNQLNISRQQYENLNKSYNSKVNELKLKEKQYNNLLEDYNIQLKDKQGLTDYLKVNEHFDNIEGLTSQEGNAVATIATALDYNYYNSIASQNKQLDYEIQNYKNIYSTDDQKVNYQSQQVYYLNNFNFYLFIIYCIFLLVLFYYLYYSKTLLRYKKIGIALLLILYPFFIIMIEKNLFNSLQYLFSVLNGIAYTKNY